MEAVLKVGAGLGSWRAYEAERRPIGLRNTIEAADNYDRSGEIFAVRRRLKKQTRQAMPRAPR